MVDCQFATRAGENHSTRRRFELQVKQEVAYDTCNRYRIVSLLGQGGMGVVYRAWDVRLDVPVALKKMIPQPGLDTCTLAQLRWQFQQEAQVLARLDHLQCRAALSRPIGVMLEIP